MRRSKTSILRLTCEQHSYRWEGPNPFTFGRFFDWRSSRSLIWCHASSTLHPDPR